MRLAFICSGLEPGRDGVGDYTRMLAQQCKIAGHETRLVAVRDSLMAGRASADIEELRLRDVYQNPEEARTLAAWLHEFQPDWASVQYSPFGFHSRGLGGRRAAFLRELMPAQTRRHLMVHEIWLQTGRDVPWRHRLLGWLQHAVVDAWAGSGWQPKINHTQARLYQAELQARGYTVELLPLCSTFPRLALSQATAREQVMEWLSEKNEKIDREAVWLGHFGAFHAQDWDFSVFAERIARHPDLAGKRICFLALGRAHSVEPAFAIATKKIPEAEFHILGELSEENVSIAMRACDAAFSSTPWDIIEKSSAIAAWRAMDTPVLVPRFGVTKPGKLPSWSDPGLILAAGNELRLTMAHEQISAPDYLNPKQTAKTFLSALTSPANARR